MKRKLISKARYIYNYSINPNFIETKPSLYTIYNIPPATRDIIHTKLSLRQQYPLRLYKVMNIEERYEKFW